MSVVKCDTCHKRYPTLIADQQDSAGGDFTCRECRFGIPITAQFQRNRDGRYVGRLILNNETHECWLTFPEGWEDASFLKLTFTDPYREKS